MALQKVDYVNQVTVITAENMNDIQDAIIALETAPSQGLSEEVKQALLQLAQKVAYIDDQGQTYYDDLYNALYPPKTVVSITAVFEQGTTVIYDDTALNDLKQYLTVTAKYDDNTTAILPDASYTLSGTLEAGTSSVTVNYNGVVTSFDVVVTARPALSSITAVYTQSGTVYDTDTLDSLKNDLVVTAHYSDSSTQTVPAADYTLSGALTLGTSTITVSYGGKTATFNVTVTYPTIYFYNGANPSMINSGGHPTGKYGLEAAVSYTNTRASAYLAEQYNNAVEYVIQYTDATRSYPSPSYPLYIPTNATKITVACPGLCCAINAHKDENGVVTTINSGYWSSVGGETDYDLSAYIAEGATHVSIGFRNSANTSIANVTIDSTTVAISFS